MTKPVTISVDAMGGDHGPAVTVAGAARALERNPDARFVFFGDSEAIEPIVAAHPSLAAVSAIVHCDVEVDMSDKPSQALRRGKWKSGMWRTIEAVRKNEADVAVSAGNTGALMAMSRFILRTLPGIDRPAIAALWPTLAGESVVLDVGAVIGADAKQLVDYSVMGGAMARALFEKSRPTVGLLNIGVEEVKGLEEVREAGRKLREADLPHLSYVGFVEGNDLGKGMVDVVVTEGFAGNIALKTAEGTARQVASYLREEMGADAPGQARLSSCQAGNECAAQEARHQSRQWRRSPRPQWHCHQEPWRRRCRRLCRRARPSHRDGAQWVGRRRSSRISLISIHRPIPKQSLCPEPQELYELGAQRCLGLRQLRSGQDPHQ